MSEDSYQHDPPLVNVKSEDSSSSTKRVKGHWTNEEDELLRMYVNLHGAKDWSQVRTLVPGRVPKQCRERWLNVLNPDIKKGPWCSGEDKQIVIMYQKYGTQWTKIAKYIPGRTADMIKNRFYGKLKKTINTEASMMPIEHPTSCDEDQILALLQQADRLEATFDDITSDLQYIEDLVARK